MKFLYNKKDVAQYVGEKLVGVKPSSVLTMTIIRDMSGAYSVFTAIEELSADTVVIKDQNS